MSEAHVELDGHDLLIVGGDGDDGVANLPPVIHEPALVAAQLLLPRDAVVLDVGANLGILTIGYARHAARVIAIEASPRTFEYLTKNLAHAGVTNVETVHVAASDSTTTLEFFDSGWFSAGSFVKESTLAANIHDGSITVPAEPIDAVVDRLGLDRLDFLKLDVEGHELPALRGAKDTIARFRPIAAIELNFFTTTSFGNTLPLDFLAEIRSIFPYVYAYNLYDGLAEVNDEHGMYKCVQNAFVTGRIYEAICSFEPLSAAAQGALARAVSPLPVPADPAALEALRTERDALRAEIDALHASSSWRLTAPVRWLGAKVRQRKA
jgi:FkbM family methyltransferase